MLTLFGVAPSASAHLRSGTVAVDYRARVFDSHTAAYSAQVFQSDRALGVTVRRGHIVVLVGYLGEPVFRLDTSGLWVNAASPTAVVDRLLKRSDRVLANTPRWRLVSGHRSVVWQDARVQGLAPGVRSGVWRVPLLVDGRRSRLQGELQRFPAPALWPWLAVLAVLLAGGAPLLLSRRRRERLRPAAVGFAAAAAVASIVVLISFAFDAYASAGTWIEAGDGLAAIAVGCWVMFRGPDQWRVAGAVGLGLVSLAVGLLEGAVFLHPIVLAVVPAVVVRVACGVFSNRGGPRCRGARSPVLHRRRAADGAWIGEPSGADVEFGASASVRQGPHLVARERARRGLASAWRVVEDELGDGDEFVSAGAERVHERGIAAIVWLRSPPASCMRMIAPGLAPASARATIAPTPGLV